MTSGPIQEYLSELRRELTLPPRLRERVLAETADHLGLAAEHVDSHDARSAEDAQRASVARFGPPLLVARRFAEELAVEDAHRVTRVVSLTTIAFCALVAVTLPSRSAGAGGPISAGLLNATAPFAVQIALTCAALSFARCFRHRDDRAVPAGKLRWILRGDAIALGVILTSVGAELISAAAGPGGAGPGPRMALVVADGAVGVRALAAASLGGG